MGKISHLRLWLWTIRYLSLRQVWSRCRRNFRRRLYKVRTRPIPPSIRWDPTSCKPLYAGLEDVIGHGPWAAEISQAVERAAAIAQKRFSFFNHAVHFRADIDWQDERLSQLWRFHLHGFDYVDDLLIWSFLDRDGSAYETFRRLVSSWIDSNRTLNSDGWHPYTISQRLVNWSNALAGFNGQLIKDRPFRKRLLSSLYDQAQFLYKDLELDVRGNHLLKNIRALLYVGMVLEGAAPRRWTQKAFGLLKKELEEQILEDGGHFERNPGYHVAVLRDCFEIAVWLRRNSKMSQTWLDDVLRRMLDYLITILSPDNKLPLFKDTVLDTATVPTDLIAAGAVYLRDCRYKISEDFGLYAFLLFGSLGWEAFKQWPVHGRKRGSTKLAQSGFYIMRDEDQGEQLILDAGNPCPDYLPAHAHADLLSYELMVGRDRVVVDSGVYEYEGGAWRDFFRSTRAHNTVEVAGLDQSEVWSSFRVARRARAGPVFWQESGDHVLFQGAHNGYRRLEVPIVHRRTVLWLKREFWLVVDELWGKGRVASASYMHFHPDVSLEAVSNSLWHIQGKRIPLFLSAFGHKRSAVVRGEKEPLYQGWYSERFGEVKPNTVLILYPKKELPAYLGYVISRRHPLNARGVMKGDARYILIDCNGSRKRLELPIHGVPHFG